MVIAPTPLLPALAITRSGRRSPSRRPAAIAIGWSPPLSNGEPASGAKLRSPLPMRTDTVCAAQFATAMSRCPSSLKSATAMPRGWSPTATGVPVLKPPVPSP